MAGMKEIWLKILHVMSKIKVFAMPERQMATQSNTTDYIDPYATRMDQMLIQSMLDS